MSKYLYGAAVQGIQDFIFKTNKLQEIVGASELVAQICTSAFDEFAVNGESIVRAAGNIKFIFEKETDCARAVREFPKKVMTMAPGITISQAVVLFENDFGKSIDELEARLKVQRNKPSHSVTSGLIGIKRANNTGLPIVEIKDSYHDAATKAKLEKHELRKLCTKSFGEFSKRMAYDISDITGKNDWIAIIHADGNGLGKVIQTVGKKKDVYGEFSIKLDDATKEAAHTAYQTVKNKFNDKQVIPIRPVVLSGDDMTVIIRGDLALDYANSFITAFEKNTKTALGHILREEKVFALSKDYLTACAGIAFIKSSYPFYYGYHLAEDLCSHAKKDTKAIFGENTNYLPPSCLMFHKVQDSFIFDYKDIVRRELTAKDGLSFKAGPYYITPQDQVSVFKLSEKKKMKVSTIEEYCKLLNNANGDGIKSGIRNWVSLRIGNKDKADQRKGRLLDLFPDSKVIKSLTKEENNICLAYDVLAYNTIMNQQTNWKSRVYLTPEGEVALTPENVFILTPKKPWPVGSFLFRLTCLL